MSQNERKKRWSQRRASRLKCLGGKVESEEERERERQRTNERNVHFDSSTTHNWGS